MSSSIPASTPGKPWKPLTPEELQPELPRYEILGLLGRGGMGAVYKARQISLKREVAIKVLLPLLEEGDMQFAERFKAEAESMARLNHPGVVAVYDAGETLGGLLYIVMEFVQGTDVGQMIRSAGRLPPETAYAITAHVCDALAYAHANGLIHRDIKPANIMVDTEGRVRVADFGLAKRVTEEHGFTQSHMAVGTPDFMAPEVLIAGIAVDGRADLYAVGVMLYQMLTGSIPRGAWHPASVVVRGLDPRFDQLILKALQYDRDQRHSSAAELRQHLDMLLVPEVPAPDVQRYSSAQMPKIPNAQPQLASEPQSGSAGAPQVQDSAVMPQSQQDASAPVKSKTPIFIAIGAVAVVGIGAFFIFGGGKPPETRNDNAPPSSTEAGRVVPNPPSVGASAQNAPTASTSESNLIKANQGYSVSDVSTPPAPKPEAPKSVVAQAPAPEKEELPKPAAPEPKQEQPKQAETKPAAVAAVMAEPTMPAAEQAPVAPSAPAALPPELATLDAAFINLRVERVTAPFDADLAKLNSNYLNGIAKKISDEKAAGHLDGILALEAEKKLITDKQSVPNTDDDKTSSSLKALRAIYRTVFAKLDATRVTNFRILTEPMDKRLAQMESDFAKADRLADAKTVRGYRKALKESTPEIPLGASQPLAMKDAITNTLGMKFVPVPIIGGPTRGQRVLFSVWETRLQDYEAFVKKTKRARPAPDFPQTGAHPVVNVRHEDAAAFCAWLTENEGKDGKLRANEIYRLPTDHEWTCAVGIGKAEDAAATPEKKNWKIAMYPWGRQYPPPARAGNYYGAETKSHPIRRNATSLERTSLESYDDGFERTAPVGRFDANEFGLHDLGGNVSEWCEDWFDGVKATARLLRGASWGFHFSNDLLSSNRYGVSPDYWNQDVGFRVVLAPMNSTP